MKTRATEITEKTVNDKALRQFAGESLSSNRNEGRSAGWIAFASRPFVRASANAFAASFGFAGVRSFMMSAKWNSRRAVRSSVSASVESFSAFSNSFSVRRTRERVICGHSSRWG